MQQIPDMGELIRLAQTPAGQQLIALLQKQGGSRLQQAIENAAAAAKSHPERLDVILAIGKGNERWIKRLNRHTPYEGDDAIFARLLG